MLIYELSIDSFRLDEEILKDIPLKERLVFKMKEDCTMILYHRSVVDAVMALEPTGMCFQDIEDYEIM